MSSIQDELSYYKLDYQEWPEARTETRWVDRITLDGTWSGNLYDFYHRVYQKLTADLKVPFSLENGIRKDEGPVHVALREALVNVLVHADYSERAPVFIMRRTDMFVFRNPGLMRIPVEVALKGGEPDCRNRGLHKMFQLVGLGEDAGSGIPKIVESWRSQHWILPNLYESTTPYNQTVLELRMIDLFPSNIISSLREQFGDTFDQLGHEERTVLALAATEGTVSHSRLRTRSTTHPADITRMLQSLTQKGMLDSNGNGRATVYFLKGQSMLMPEAVFGSSPLEPSSSVLRPSSSPLEPSSSVLRPSSSVLRPSSSVLTLNRDEEGRLLTDKLPLPIIDDLSQLSPNLRNQLEQLAEAPRQKRKLPRAELKAAISSVCQNHYFTLQALAGLLQRKPVALRNEYLAPMVRERALWMAFPATPTHERQAYTATKLEEEDAPGPAAD